MKRLWEWHQQGRLIYYMDVEPKESMILMASNLYKPNGSICEVGEVIAANPPYTTDQFTECIEYPKWFSRV